MDHETVSVDHESVVEQWRRSAQLHDDRCTIYNLRPTVCREYPHTDKEGFTFRTIGVANNALRCPAVFWLVEEMKKRCEARERKKKTFVGSTKAWIRYGGRTELR